MNSSKRFATTLLATLGLSALSYSQQADERVELVFRPDPNIVLRKSWTSRQNLRPAMAYISSGGQRQKQDIDLTLEATQTLVVADQYKVVEGGRPLGLRRLYESAAVNTSLVFAGKDPMKTEQLSTVQGTSVIYTWVDDEGMYGKYYNEREAPEKLLAGLWEDLDLRDMLPDKGLAALGESWEISATELNNILAPGGDVPLGVPQTSEPITMRSLRAGVGAHLFRAFENCNGSGGLKLRLSSVEDHPEGRIAVIEVEADLRLASDQTHYVRSKVTTRDRVMGAVFHSSDLIFELRGKGQLKWNLDQARAQSFTLKGPQETSYRIKNSYRGDGDNIREQFMRMTGIFELSLTVEALTEFPTARPAKVGNSGVELKPLEAGGKRGKKKRQAEGKTRGRRVRGASGDKKLEGEKLKGEPDGGGN